jgi:hypothetical protein
MRRATYRWKTLDEDYNFALNLIVIEGLHATFCASKARESQLWESHLGVLGQKTIWMWPSWRAEKYTIKGKVVASPSPGCGESCVSELPVVHPSTKSAPTIH